MSVPLFAASGDYAARRLAAACVVVGTFSLLFILDFTGYPFPPYRFWILPYLLRTQDVAGSLLLLLLVLAAFFVPTRAAALGLVDAVAKHPWLTAAVTFVVLCAGTLYVEHNHPLAQDEYAALFQSKAFAAGRLTGWFPPDLMGRLIPPFYMNHFFYGSPVTGEVASAYWPGFALLLAPFTLVGAPWAFNPLLASLALVLIGRIAVRLTDAPRARGWAMLLALGSPAFTGMALTYFSMTAHLLLNLVFVSLLLERSIARLLLAGVVGSYALVLHNPLPHTLFALPWIAWLARQPAPYRSLAALAAGYLPLASAIGFGWALLLSDLQGPVLHGLFPPDTSALHRVANFFWAWHIKMRSALAGPGDNVVATRLAEAVRLWQWAVPGLVLLAAAGWWLDRRNAGVRLLGLSLLVTAAGYLFIGFSQGHGWGARYFHPAWGALPVLGAVALVRLAPADLRGRFGGYVANLALLSLLFATALRAWQIDEYFDRHLANRPAVPDAGRHLVFVTFDRAGYTADLVQNDPFLRGDVWYLFSFGAERDAELMRGKFPGARLVSSDGRGHVWQLP